MGIHTYKTRGVCSKSITVELEGDIIKRVAFTDGCDGNLKGISQLVAGMDIDTVIDRVGEVRCGDKSTSCPAQLALALRQAREAELAERGDRGAR